ncbi:hypothetical protein O0882_08095 [Janthinobacterium sp. SUN073]|uniref:hypothetical protein n=1 Tax=Janthinobacterium sp. SUN073 TaxID=3004102 RepID=UPI0025B0FE95|nr:hypothetical protein [Janthinobacterium sp. SUN073]MDN2696273.1 hypothetical protein [Janthinobacterium sp. SUN073]
MISLLCFTEKNVEEVKACPAKEIRRAILHEQVPAHTLLWICNAIVRDVDDGGGKPQRGALPCGPGANMTQAVRKAIDGAAAVPSTRRVR